MNEEKILRTKTHHYHQKALSSSYTTYKEGQHEAVKFMKKLCNEKFIYFFEKNMRKFFIL